LDHKAVDGIRKARATPSPRQSPTSQFTNFDKMQLNGMLIISPSKIISSWPEVDRPRFYTTRGRPTGQGVEVEAENSPLLLQPDSSVFKTDTLSEVGRRLVLLQRNSSPIFTHQAPRDLELILLITSHHNIEGLRTGKEHTRAGAPSINTVPAERITIHPCDPITNQNTENIDLHLVHCPLGITRNIEIDPGPIIEVSEEVVLKVIGNILGLR
jgi:hypothetical protein